MLEGSIPPNRCLFLPKIISSSAILNFSSVASSGFVGLPPFQICKFDVTAILVMAPIAIATMMEHVGDMSAISATVDENFIAEPGLHRTLLGDGLATAFAGCIGGPANTTYGENTGVLELSRVTEKIPAIIIQNNADEMIMVKKFLFICYVVF